ncbi:MAG: glycerol kinase GlpK [Dehalococcoidia bacterium]|nr:glycerol kinase GlpK [Dehalococcoidia bacterium]MDD5493613.1 glycerol kinase GlpK [Dehalococcoidia bacterium]
MADAKYILSIDQGTTGSAAIIFNSEGNPVSDADTETKQIYPRPGWVEHDPMEIWQTSLQVARQAIQKANIRPSQVAGLGITNQRETTIIWEKKTGKPVNNAIVWQCRRTAELVEDLKNRGLADTIREKTGLIPDAYFSATKIRWILDHIADGQSRAEHGELLFGTVDTWLAWNLSGGKAHVTDYSNASRTMIYNIHSLQWDKDILAALNIPDAILPKVIPSSYIYGETIPDLFDGARIPLASIAGDQQAALFGQVCCEPGMAKNTYGTGSFILLNSGDKPIISRKGLLTSLAWGLDGKVAYTLEGSVFITGAAVQWLRDGLSIIKSASEIEALARSVPDNGDVYFVPAFVGLGAPYWDMYARGTIIGLTRGSTKGHLARATLEGIAYQVRDVVEAMESDANVKIPILRVDGGGTANSLLMQFQADILGIRIQPSAIAETTALGAAYLAGLAVGIWKNVEEISKQWHVAKTYEPLMSQDQREQLYSSWKRAVSRAQSWISS